MPPPLEAGVQVTVIAGPAQGSMVITDATGAYRLQIRAGVFRLRWSKAGFLPVESAEQALEAGGGEAFRTVAQAAHVDERECGGDSRQERDGTEWTK